MVRPRIEGTNEEHHDISGLPVDILLEILSRLKLRDFVATRTLSSYWREAWDLKHPSRLEFNWKSMFLTEKNQADWEDSKQPCVMQRDRFLQEVDQFLQFYKGTDVEVFSIQFLINGSTMLSSEFELDVLGFIFSVKKANSSSFFINLTGLALSRIRIPAVIAAESFPHLVKLAIYLCSNVREIKLNNQKLLLLLCVSRQPVAFNIGGAPNLVDLMCYANESVLRSIFSLAAQGHQSLKVMRIMSSVDWGDCIPRIGGTMGFRTVTDLFLAFNHISKHVTLLRVFPNLKKLKLQLDCPSDVEQGAVSPTDDMMHMHLDGVQVYGILFIVGLFLYTASQDENHGMTASMRKSAMDCHRSQGKTL
ncbi:hypothetical protein Droror1_Dr00016140, partial [Drosera rotundifolia]